MIKFTTRSAARSFAKGKKKVIDLHATTLYRVGSRWAVVILKKEF